MVLRRGRRRRYVARLGVCLALLVAAWCAVTFVSLRHAAGEGGEALLMPPGGGGVRGARGAAEAPREAALARACAQRWALPDVRRGAGSGAARVAPGGSRCCSSCTSRTRSPAGGARPGPRGARRRGSRRCWRRTAAAASPSRAAGLDYYEKRRDLALGGAAAFVAVGGAVNATSRPRYDERARGTRRAPRGTSRARAACGSPRVVRRRPAAWCAEDALRLAATLSSRGAAGADSSIYGGKAVVIYDGAAAVAPAPDGGARSARAAARAPNPVRRGAAPLRRLPAAAPKHVRCCGEEEDPGGCVWRPTLLERTEGSGTAEALERARRSRRRPCSGARRRARGRRVLGEEEPSSRDAKNLRSAILEEIVRRREVEIAALKNAEADPLHAADLGDDDGAKRLKAEAKAAFTRIVTLPKVIPANATAPWASAIPRVIFQTFRSRSVPFRLREAVMSWSRANPAYEHRIFDDDDMGAFVVETFGWDSREIRALNAAPSARARADLFRYLVIHAHGGVYADADSVCVRPLDAWLDADEDRLVVALNGPPRFDVSQWAFARAAGHRVLAAAAALAVDNLLRSSGNLPRKRGAKKAGAFPKNFTARPPNVVPVFRGLRPRLREDPPAALAASEPALAAAAARDRETKGGYDVEARWECPVANVNQIGDEGSRGRPCSRRRARGRRLRRRRRRRQAQAPDRAPLVRRAPPVHAEGRLAGPGGRARATANRPLSLGERFAVRAAFRELVSLRPRFGAAINSKYADEQSYKDDLATAGVKHWSDAWAEYDMGIYNILNPQTPPTPNPTPEVPETPAPTLAPVGREDLGAARRDPRIRAARARAARERGAGRKLVLPPDARGRGALEPARGCSLNSLSTS
ncbi:hypothetical protein SO694_00060171 [Aureococcus anophagefferens]|uniref:Alpha 1,4-glycosyltransferase domain-containing protein n=1 Tax=Aureococcus anophagefferens TaxID=44056 RepID=A0ABR1FRA6_AURAN